ncbi:MAG: ABC transporter permease [Anaerolineae bacterium]
MILRNLLRRRTRTLLTLVGIAIGVAAIVALVAIADGLASGYTDVLSGSQADLVITQAESVDASFSAIDEGVGPQLASIPGVEEVSGMIIGEITTEGIRYFLIFGYDPTEFAIQHFKVVEGQGLTAKREIIIGKLAAQNLKKEVGDTIWMYESAYRIVGIYETGTALEEGGGVISLSDAQAMLKKPRQVSIFQVKLEDVDKAEEVQRRIERRFPDLTVTRSTEFADKQLAIQFVRAFAWALSFLAVLIGGVGMMNMLLMSVFERTREIGVLRALGWRRSKVLFLILGESLLLSLLGGLVGAALGVAAVKALGRLPATGGLLQGRFSWELFARAGLVTLTLGTFGGLYPAWWASRLHPIEALRYEGGGAEIAVPRLPGGMTVRNLLRRRTRTLLTLVGIGISVAAVVALKGIADGFVEHFTAIATGAGADLMAVEANISDMQYSAIDERVGKRIAGLSGVESVSGIVMGATIGEDAPMMIIFGYHPAEYAIRHFRIVEGDRLTASRQIILGRTAAEALNKKVGDRVQVLNRAFRVVGIYETGVSYEDSGGVISLREAQALFGRPRHVMFLGIKLDDPRRAEEVRNRIEENFPEITISISSEFAERLPDLQTTESMVGGISLLAVMVGGVGMMNTMVISIFERTREIGVLRALGWRRSKVLSMVLRESLLLGVVSGLAGVVMGVTMDKALGLLPFIGGFLQPSFKPSTFIQALIMALVLGLIGGLYPAWWASRLRPIEALRYE